MTPSARAGADFSPELGASLPKEHVRIGLQGNLSKDSLTDYTIGSDLH